MAATAAADMYDPGGGTKRGTAGATGSVGGLLSLALTFALDLSECAWKTVRVEKQLSHVLYGITRHTLAVCASRDLECGGCVTLSAEGR